MRFTLVLTLFTLIGYAADENEDLLAAVRKGDLAAVKALRVDSLDLDQFEQELVKDCQVAL